MGLDLNKVVCSDCGIPYLTEEQKESSGVYTFYTDKCCKCKEVKSVTSVRHYNYLNEPKK